MCCLNSRKNIDLFVIRIEYKVIGLLMAKNRGHIDTIRTQYVHFILGNGENCDLLLLEPIILAVECVFCCPCFMLFIILLLRKLVGLVVCLNEHFTPCSLLYSIVVLGFLFEELLMAPFHSSDLQIDNVSKHCWDVNHQAHWLKTKVE